MIRLLLTFTGLFSGSSPVILDTAIKATVILVLAAAAAMILRRDSAATRHLAWLLAIVAMLVLPVLSALLPQWRVLPEWARIPAATAKLRTIPHSMATPADEPIQEARRPDRRDVESPHPSALPPAAEPAERTPALVAPEATAAPADPNWSGTNAMPLVWATGLCVLSLRLFAARAILWITERAAALICSTSQNEAIQDPLAIALRAAHLQLALSRPVTLLIHAKKSIPMVWGILHCRLLLPADARRWSSEQLRSVLLHELAHIKRGDTVAQSVAQIACALHWFNPLAWFAAWRLSAESEQACDDLVLAGGVRPSAYAGHLLDIVTGLSPSRWTQSCGLAMARKSSLEGRLAAMLSENLNRRDVSVVVAAISLAIAAGIAVPVAMLRAADEKPGASGPQKQAQKPTGVVKPLVALEKLQWGEPVNGLRAALVIRPSSDEPNPQTLDLFLAVENVSNTPVRLIANAAAPNPRTLTIKSDAVIIAEFDDKKAVPADFSLEPREVALFLMFPPLGVDSRGRSAGSGIVHDALNDEALTLIAEMKIEHAPSGAWRGTLVTGETSGAVAAGKPQPKDKTALALFKLWRHSARKNGNIPGGLIGRIRDEVNNFIKLNSSDRSGHGYAKKIATLLPRFDSTRDWNPAETAALLDDIAAIYASPMQVAIDRAGWHTIRTGAPLPPELAGAPWGEAMPNGLRAAWAIEPSVDHHRLGVSLRSRIYIHNSGANTVVFRTRSWHQSGQHKAHDENGANIQIDSTDWTTHSPLVPFRLAPGEFVELSAAGIGVGAKEIEVDWQGVRVGARIEAKENDEVTFTPDSVPLSDWMEPPPPDGEPGWWSGFVGERLNGDLPLPAAADERAHLLNRVMRDLFGTAPGAEEMALFTSDLSPAALDSLARRLVHRPGVTPFTGVLKSGSTKFRVLPADPDAAKRPRTASTPGRYTLGENIRLVVSRRLDGRRTVNEASIEFFSPDPTKPPPGQPHAVRLPDGYNTWVAAWAHDSDLLWVRQKGDLSSYDFSNPTQVKETTVVQPADLGKVPAAIIEALGGAANSLDRPATPKEAP
jgi:beta-lactamase regulating signal transducer with metallopeptidase domain